MVSRRVYLNVSKHRRTFTGVGNLSCPRCHLDSHNILHRPDKMINYKVAYYRFIEYQVLPMVFLVGVGQVLSQVLRGAQTR